MRCAYKRRPDEITFRTHALKQRGMKEKILEIKYIQIHQEDSRQGCAGKCRYCFRNSADDGCRLKDLVCARECKADSTSIGESNLKRPTKLRTVEDRRRPDGAQLGGEQN